MRRVLADRHEVAHYWANKVQSEGKAGNVFFQGDHIYSYGRHFCIARILPSHVAAFTTRSYSPSTQCHISIARRAWDPRAVVYCNDPADSAGTNLRQARNDIRTCLTAAKRKGIRQTTRDAHTASALRIAQNVNAYLAALPANESAGVVPIDTTSLDAMSAELTRIEAAEQAMREQQHAARLADLQTSLQAWRSRAICVRTGLFELPVALRLSVDGSIVQTSYGAEIPAEDARNLWPLIESARQGARDWQPGRPVGVYQLTRIRADGSIVVGCHDIAYSELESIAIALGLIPQAIAA